MSDVVQSLRQALQDVVAPELREHRVLLTALDSKIDSVRTELRTEIGALRSELRGEIGAVRSELRGEIGAVRSDLRSEIDTLKLAVQNGFEKLQHGFESAVLRGEVSTVRELADLRSRVERIEDHLKLRQDEGGPRV